MWFPQTRKQMSLTDIALKMQQRLPLNSAPPLPCPPVISRVEEEQMASAGASVGPIHQKAVSIILLTSSTKRVFSVSNAVSIKISSLRPKDLSKRVLKTTLV